MIVVNRLLLEQKWPTPADLSCKYCVPSKNEGITLSFVCDYKHSVSCADFFLKDGRSRAGPDTNKDAEQLHERIWRSIKKTYHACVDCFLSRDNWNIPKRILVMQFISNAILLFAMLWLWISQIAQRNKESIFYCVTFDPCVVVFETSEHSWLTDGCFAAFITLSHSKCTLRAAPIISSRLWASMRKTCVARTLTACRAI